VRREAIGEPVVVSNVVELSAEVGEIAVVS
jgi:hypothetical protein